MKLLRLKDSASQLGCMRTITALALLTALYVILHLFFTVSINPVLQIRFSFLAILIAGLLFGVVGGGMVSIAGDLLSFLVKPTGFFFPGFTLNAMLIGMIYGVFLYQQWNRSVKILFRITIAKCLSAIIVELLLTPLWLSMLYHDAYLVLLQARLFKTIIFLPIDIILAYGMIRLLPTQIKLRYSVNKKK